MAPRAAAAEPKADWQNEIADELARKIFSHLAEHGAVTEAEATRILGGPRQFRRFSRSFDELCGVVPFAVRIETTATGKRYVRDGADG